MVCIGKNPLNSGAAKAPGKEAHMNKSANKSSGGPNMTSKEKKVIGAYYKRRFYNGRTAFARAVDYIALRVILLIACYLWFAVNVQSLAMAAVLTIASVTAISIFAELVKSIRFEKFCLREKERLRRKLFTESLALMPKAEFLCIVREYIKSNAAEFAGESLVYTAQTIAPVDEETVLSACRTAAKKGRVSLFIFSASSVSREARALAARYENINVAFIPSDMLCASASSQKAMPSDADIAAYIIKQNEQRITRRKKAFSEPFGAARSARYILVAAALFTLSFFVKYTLYYRVLAGACISLAALSFYIGHAPSAASKNA